jgi:hypothetical protein
MGGHGAWHLAANDPDGFASVAPSAGWISFDTYGSRPRGRLSALWQAADAASLTLDLLDNLAGLPTYVLHGTADDNVPASEARRMEQALRPRNPRFESHYQEGAGHWWDANPAPGADCVDWPGFFAMFRRHRIPEHPPRIELLTVDPGVDARHHWASVLQPLQYGTGCWLRAERTPGGVVVETRNVRRLALDPPPDRPHGTVSLDGQAVPWSADGWRQEGGTWRAATGPVPAGEKRPERTGPFKRAYGRGFTMVYGTAGNAAETRANLDRARYDAETWLVRGNGRALLLSDAELLAADPGDGNVILYGNADTNAAWSTVVDDACPISVRRGEVRAGPKTFEGPSLAALFVRPRKGSADALVGVVSATGPAGMRLTLLASTFASGAGIPDFLVFGPETLARGDEGVRLAGFFDVTWGLAAE